jgi:uncharacterized protein
MAPADLLRKHLDVVSARLSVEETKDVYHDDVTMEFPFSPEGHTKLLNGPEAIVNFFARIPSFADNFQIGEPAVHAIDSGLVAIYPGSSTFKDTGLPYSQEYVLFVTIRDGRIAKLVEYYDGQRVLRAMGELV